MHEKRIFSPEHLDVSRLPSVKTYEELAGSEDLPLDEKDFERLSASFDRQVAYFEKLADESNSNEERDVFLRYAARIPELYKLIRENVRIITESQLDQSLEDMRVELEKFVGEGDYLVLLHGENSDEAKLHSPYYVAKKLGISEDRMITEEDLLDDSILERLRNGAKVIIGDDASYSGQNLLLEHLYPLQNTDFELKKGQVFLGLVGATQSAGDLINKEFGDIAKVFCYLNIPEVGSVFEGEDYRILRNMNRPLSDGDSWQIPFNHRDVLTLFWHKVPDNFVQPLRKNKNRVNDNGRRKIFKGYLVDDLPGGIYPSYRDGEEFIYS